VAVLALRISRVGFRGNINYFDAPGGEIGTHMAFDNTDTKRGVLVTTRDSARVAADRDFVLLVRC
jgi:hypothetical protein